MLLWCLLTNLGMWRGELVLPKFACVMNTPTTITREVFLTRQCQLRSSQILDNMPLFIFHKTRHYTCACQRFGIRHTSIISLTMVATPSGWKATRIRSKWTYILVWSVKKAAVLWRSMQPHIVSGKLEDVLLQHARKTVSSSDFGFRLTRERFSDFFWWSISSPWRKNSTVTTSPLP